MKKTVYITGHRNPDSDSITSAISYAYLKNQLCDKNYIPIRLGELNRETKFILKSFNIEEPVLMDTIRLQVADLDYDRNSLLMETITIKEAQDFFKEEDKEYAVVVNKRYNLSGIITLSTLNKVYVENSLSKVLEKSSLDNITKTLNAEVLIENKKTKKYSGNIWIAALSEENIKEYIKKDDIAIVGDREDVQEILIKNKISLMIIIGGFKLNKKLMKLAKDNNVTVLSTSHDSLSVARLLPLSVDIKEVMVKDDILYFNHDDLVNDVKKIIMKNRYRSFPILDETKKVLGIVSRYDLLSKDKKQLIMVDHNEYSQSIEGIEDSEIKEVVDHHRIADIQSSQPIFLRNEPVGSTATIVAKLFMEKAVTIPKEIAGLLMSGIVSDTLLFKSPTCTEIDIEICKQLQEIAEVKDLHNFALEMQKKATSLRGLKVQDVFESDFKEFVIGNRKVGIAQFNTIDFKSFEKMKKEMIFLMESQLRYGDYDILMLALTNIIDEGSLCIVTGEKKIFEKAFEVELNHDEVYIQNLLSRKKQMVPILSDYILEN